MSKVINWELNLRIKDDKSYEKLINYLGKSQLYSFEANPMAGEGDSGQTHVIIIYCSWTNNLKYLTKWIDKNISDDIF